MGINAVIFDRDNTLIKFDQDTTQAFQQRVQACLPNLSSKALITHWQSWPGPWPKSPADEPAFWRTFWAALAHDYHLDTERIEALCDIGATYHTCFTAFEDARSCVQTLHTAGLSLAVLTNFELPSIDLTLAHAGLDPSLFDVTLSSATLGVWKPDPRAFQAAAAALGEPLECCAFVDDLAEHVATARALGMRAFLLDRTRSTHDLTADLLCSLEPLPRVIRPPSLRD